MSQIRRIADRLGGEALAIVIGTIAGMILGAVIGFALFAVGELLAETVFGFEGFGDGPFLDMSPRSRLRGGFLILGAGLGVPPAWWWMRRMARRDRSGDDPSD